jgi:hypothetical protein
MYIKSLSCNGLTTDLEISQHAGMPTCDDAVDRPQELSIPTESTHNSMVSSVVIYARLAMTRLPSSVPNCWTHQSHGLFHRTVGEYTSVPFQ